MIGLGRAYTIIFAAVSCTAQQDLIYIKPAADKITIIEMVKLAASGGTADAGDAQEELLDVELIRVPATVTASSGGGTYTPGPLAVNDTAYSGTARINDTTKATTSGTIKVLDADGFNNRVPYLYLPAPEHRPIVANAEAIVFRLNTTPADAILLSGTMIIRELP
jgi:hypothetical protein